MNYDTLVDATLPDDANIADVYNAVMGAAMQHDDVVGVITTGPITVTHNHGSLYSWGNEPVSFESHPESWQVRSSPKGRIGLPMKPDEIREVVILIRDGTQMARVSIIKLWRNTRLTPKTATASNISVAYEQNLANSDRGTKTFGALGVAYHGISIFNERLMSYTGSLPSIINEKLTHRTAISAYATISGDSHRIVSLETNKAPHYVIAAHLGGFSFPDPDVFRQCEDVFTAAEWYKTERQQLHDYFVAFSAHQRLKSPPQSQMQPQKPIAFDLWEEEMKPENAARLMHSAEWVFEQASFIGLLDKLGDPFYTDALPDALHQPCGVAFVLAVAVRIACDSERWHLSPTRGDDAFATKEAAFLFEAVQPGILPQWASERHSYTYAIDLVIEHATQEIMVLLGNLRSGKCNTRASVLDPDRIDKDRQKAMAYLHCAGIAICQDTCGLLPKNEDGTSGLYSETGSAAWYSDVATESRAVSAYSAGLGAVVPKCNTHRSSTRGRRQAALVRTLQNVEHWLCRGTYNSVKLKQTLLPDADGTESVRTDDFSDTSISAASVATAFAAATATSTATNAPRKKKWRNTGSKDVNATLANNGKRRGATEKHCIDRVINSTILTTCGYTKRLEIEEACHRQLNGTALDDACGVLGDVLQMGPVFCIGQRFDVQTYAVASKSDVRCAHCPRTVNVVESVGFAGVFGKCSRCAHPRCLHCVSEDINLVSANAHQPSAVAEPTSLQMDSCLMCCSFDVELTMPRREADMAA